jgi:transposase
MARKTYTREFKIEAIQLAESSDKPMAQIARELGVHPNTLYKWRVA